MTIEEAISEFRYPLKPRNDPESRNAFLDAVEMAIDSLIVPVLTPSLEVVNDLDETERGANGFGSTGR